MSEHDRRGGWLSRVFGAGGDPRGGEVPLSEIVVQLEGELAELRTAHGELADEHRARGGDLDTSRVAAEQAEARLREREAELALARKELALARKEQLAARAAAEVSTATIAAEASAKQGLVARVAALTKELGVSHAERMQLTKDLVAARADVERERARVVSAQVSVRQLRSSHDEATKVAHAERIAREAELATARSTLAESHRNREADHRAAEAAIDAERHAWRAREADLDEALAGLRALVERAVGALDAVLGRGAALAVRGTSARITPADPAIMPIADAVAALERALRATGWVTRVTLVEAVGEAPRLTLLATARASSPAARALLEDAAAAWLARRAGLAVSVRIDDARPAEATAAAPSPDR